MTPTGALWITPARAGEHLAVGQTIAAWVGSPRVGGEHTPTDERLYSCNRITPA